MSDSRERFEAHVLRETPEAHMNRNALDAYECPGVQREWRTWQAAEAQAVRRCAEIVADYWPAADDIRAEFPEAFK